MSEAIEPLKECPFCGGKKPEHKREGAGNWRVCCTADGCGASVHGQTRNRLGSRTAWNKRSSASLDECRAALAVEHDAALVEAREADKLRVQVKAMGAVVAIARRIECAYPGEGGYVNEYDELQSAIVDLDAALSDKPGESEA